ncbi:UDP-glucose 4-epimerase GalE [Lysobacter olei]
MARIVVTGGAGYIGSHTCVLLAHAGHEVTVVDSLVNASPMAVERASALVGQKIDLIVQDVCSQGAMRGVLQGADAVVHFAGLKAVGESVEQPLAYYANNVGGTISLLKAMGEAGVNAIVFSSSATVYGNPEWLPIDELARTGATNPYGHSKLMSEQIIRDACVANPDLAGVLLRYFNPVGAHPSGHIGEDPNGVPNNLMPFVAQVAVGRRDRLQVFGGDYPTADGTGVRDYIHVMDLAEAHVAAVEHALGARGAITLNLGTGTGYSVLEMVRAFEKACGRPIPFEITGRRAGDVAALWADPTLAQTTLGWRARRGLGEMCRDAWAWQSANPHGYGT